MRITAIKQQEKLKDRYSVFVEEKYAFSLSSTALLQSKLVVGQEVSEQEIKAYEELSAEDKLYGLVLRYLALRPRSQYEIETYLVRKKAPQQTQQKILDMLCKSNLVDDEAFARAWVENRRLLKPMSRRRLQLELRQKRVSQEIIEQVLQEDEIDDKIVLQELIARKRKQVKYQNTEKLMAYLSRQGFSYGDIKEALQAEEY